jgi:hypothetical protein
MPPSMAVSQYARLEASQRVDEVKTREVEALICAL